MQGAGGTRGGIGMFFLGAAMVVAGGYLLLTRVVVSSGYWMWSGTNLFGLSLLPLVVGIGMLFFDGRSKAGWILVVLGAVIILAGLLANMHVYFAPTSLYDTLVMLVLLAGGVGLVARSLRAYPAD